MRTSLRLASLSGSAATTSMMHAQAFDAALREISPDGGFAGVFAGLSRLRTIPRWTFNQLVVEGGHRTQAAWFSQPHR